MTLTETPLHTSAEPDDVNVKNTYVNCWKRTQPRPRPLLPTPQVPPLA